MSDLSGRVAVVTGGVSNLGAAIVGAFSAAGAEVVIADLDDRPRGEGAVGHVIRTDISSADDVDRLVSETVERFGRIDYLVNNAAVWHRRPVAEITPEEWDRVLGINLRGPFLCSRAVAPVMKDQGGGVIINIGSQAGAFYTRGQGAHYQVSKAAVSHLARVLAFEFGPMNIRVNCVAPGLLRGDSTEPMSPPMVSFLDQTPLGRFATHADVAAACLFFVSDAAAAVTGQTLLVNGGALAYL